LQLILKHSFNSAGKEPTFLSGEQAHQNAVPMMKILTAIVTLFAHGATLSLDRQNADKTVHLFQKITVMVLALFNKNIQIPLSNPQTPLNPSQLLSIAASQATEMETVKLSELKCFQIVPRNTLQLMAICALLMVTVLQMEWTRFRD